MIMHDRILFLFLFISTIYLRNGAAAPTSVPTIQSSLLSQKPRLYDLENDKYEATNVYSDPGYAKDLDLFQERVSYWQKYTKSPWVAPEGLKETIWNENGGVRPWISAPNVDSNDDRISSSYQYDKAPNIIFVLVDDWGWNDFGRRSTYLSWTTPAIDSLSYEGISLENYYTYQSCSPTRGALLTGRFPLRLGLWEIHDQAELPIEEITLAEELQKANYRTYLVGKWHLGFSTMSHVPTKKGFDYFYGFYSSYIDYWTKSYGGYLDLQENDELVTSKEEISSSLHSGYLFQSKAEKVIKEHANKYSNRPMFLYYSMQLVHSPWTAPKEYLSRCQVPTVSDQSINIDALYNMCGMNLMLDEAIANLTCTLKEHDMADNSILIISSDNGGEATISGNSYPYKGHKGNFYRGGLSATAIIHSKRIPESARGSTYHGLVHVTDWFPTIMGLATDGKWNSNDRVDKDALDGFDMWDPITKGTISPHEEIIHYINQDNAVIQIKNLKLFTGQSDNKVDNPAFVFEDDLKPSSISITCESPSLMESSLATYKQFKDSVLIYSSIAAHVEKSLIYFVGILILCITGIVLVAIKYQIFHMSGYVDDRHRENNQLDDKAKESARSYGTLSGRIVAHTQEITDSTPFLSNKA